MRSIPTNLKPYLAAGIASLVIVVLLVSYGDAENPKKVSLERLQNLEQEIAAFVAANKRAPAGLSELGLPAEQLRDHIGEPFIYRVDEGSITVLSYGSDKEPGGSFFKRDYSVTIELP